MMRHWTFLSLFFCWTLCTQAQVFDEFSDGDFTLNPGWLGDTAQFSVVSGKLVLDAVGSDSASLVTQWNAPNAGDTLEWSFELTLDFAPSSQNFARVYLWSDTSSLETALNGLYLQFGETGAADAVIVRGQSGWSSTTLFRGRDSLIAQGGTFSIRFVLDPSGNANLWSARAGGIAVQEGSFLVTWPPPSAFFGLKCTFTSSNAKAFGLDQVYAGPIRHDTIPPIVLSAVAVQDTLVRVECSEPVMFSIGTGAIAMVHPPGLASFQFVPDPSNPAALFIVLPISLCDTILYDFVLSGIRDMAGNTMQDTARFKLFVLRDADPGMVVISEIMANPDDAPGLPQVEYVEIYNRSLKFLNISGWSLADASSAGSLSNASLAPGAFRVIAASGAVQALELAGVTDLIVAANMPTLNNDGDVLTLCGPEGVIDRVAYDAGMYRDPLRDDHGWSLERMDLSFPCHDRLNWKASTDSSGGTPGRENSVVQQFNDVTAPEIHHAFPESDSVLRVYFSETMDSTDLMNPLRYFLHPSGIYPLSVQTDAAGQTALLGFGAGAFQQSQLYTLHIDPVLSDCPGNLLDGTLAIDFALPSNPDAGDVIINEVLFNPLQDDGDFVELYNASAKTIDLSRLRLVALDESGMPVGSPFMWGSGPRILLPGAYAVAATAPDPIAARYPSADAHVFQSADLPSLPDDEGGLLLLTDALSEIDRFSYRSSMHHPLISNPEGISLERVSSFKASADAGNWHSASSTSGFATPGIRNSQDLSGQQIPEGDWLTLSSRLFSPDNDGRSDLLQLHVTWPKPGFMGRIVIFDETGNQVRELGAMELSGTASDWLWDGRDAEGEPCDEGIYFLIARFLHIEGEVLQCRTSCVLARAD